MLGQFERELMIFLSRGPGRPEIRSFVRKWYSGDQEANRQITDRARFLILLQRVCEED